MEQISTKVSYCPMGHLLKYHFVKNLQEQIGGNLGNQESDAKNSLKHKMFFFEMERRSTKYLGKLLNYYILPTSLYI